MHARCLEKALQSRIQKITGEIQSDFFVADGDLKASIKWSSQDLEALQKVWESWKLASGLAVDAITWQDCARAVASALGPQMRKSYGAEKDLEYPASLATVESLVNLFV